MGSTGLNAKRFPLCRKLSAFETYMRRNKVSVIAQMRAPFPSIPCVQQMAIASKYGDCQNLGTLYLKRLCYCALLRCSVENIQLKAYTHKKRRFLFSSGNHGESGAPVLSDILTETVSTLWRKMLFSQ